MILPPIAAGIALVAFAMSSKEPPGIVGLEEARTPVRIVTVEPHSFVPRVSGFGSVEPARTWDAVAQVSGRVDEVHSSFINGGTVAKDDVLVRIAPDDYELAIAQAHSQIESAAAEIEEMNLSGETIGRSLEIEREAFAIAQRELERQRDLAERNTVAASVVEAQESSMLAQRAKVQDLENQLLLLPSKLKALEQSKVVAEAALEIAVLNLKRTVITAPFDARIAQADVEVSQYVGTGTTMGSLDGIAAAEIDVQISPRQMAGFARLAFAGRDPSTNNPAGRVPRNAGLGAKVHVAFPGTGQGWDAEVTRISDTVDPETRSIGVIVSVPEPYGQVRPGERPPLIKGMFTEVELHAPAVEDVILLPRTAIRDGKVMIADPDDRLALAHVTVVYTYDDVAVLRVGLDAGTRVVVSDPAPAIEGMLLEPIPAPDVTERMTLVAMPPETGQ
ncbi:MAG: efflux RND transporter periplasmic adaptor subunit [Geminicoccaceae bacterium]